MPINSFLYPAPSTPSFVYNVANSCRFDKGSSPSLSKTSGTPTNALKWTFSAWVKISSIGNDTFLLDFNTDGNNRSQIGFQDADKAIIVYEKVSGSTSQLLQTSAQFRDPTGWLNIVVSCDRTLGTDTERTKIYVNGTRVTSFSTADGGPNYPAQNTNGIINTAVSTLVGKYSQSTLFYDGYMCEVVFIDGTAYAASDFGEFDEDSPTIWKPKDPSGLTFGTNGFYLDFEDSSNLGNDANGGTDFTETNIVAADQATDTCTNNFCTVNPLDQYGTYTLSEGNCQITSGHTSWYTIGSTMAVQNGKWYWEVEFDAGTMIEIFVGVHDTSVNRTDTNSWLTGSSLFYNDAGGEIRTDGTNSTADYGTLSAGDILGIALNMDDKQITLYKNGSAIASNVALSTSISEAMPTFLTDSNDVVFKVNFGGCPSFAISSGNTDGNGYGNFEFSVPSNYYSLCTKNLAEYG